MKRLFYLIFCSFPFLLLDSNLRCGREMDIWGYIGNHTGLPTAFYSWGTGIGQDRNWHGWDWHSKGNMILDSGKKGEGALRLLDGICIVVGYCIIVYAMLTRYHYHIQSCSAWLWSVLLEERLRDGWWTLRNGTCRVKKKIDICVCFFYLNYADICIHK